MLSSCEEENALWSLENICRLFEHHGSVKLMQTLWTLFRQLATALCDVVPGEMAPTRKRNVHGGRSSFVIEGGQ
jgi:hypothetical protein